METSEHPMSVTPAAKKFGKLATLWLIGALGALDLSASVAAQDRGVNTLDFSGAWRLDDLQSDSAQTVSNLLAQEADRERPPQVQSAAPAVAITGAGKRGGMGGGGHGRAGGKSKPAASSGEGDAGIAPKLPLSPLFDIDNVLIVQQDQKTVTVQLSSGEVLTGRLNGPAQPSLNGSAMVHTELTGDIMTMTIQFDDGSRLIQQWTQSSDHHALSITEQWKISALQDPVRFHRRYIALN